MSDNYTFKDAADATVTGASQDVGGVQFPKNHLVDDAGALINPATEDTLDDIKSGVGTTSDAAVVTDTTGSLSFISLLLCLSPIQDLPDKSTVSPSTRQVLNRTSVLCDNPDTLTYGSGIN